MDSARPKRRSPMRRPTAARPGRGRRYTEPANLAVRATTNCRWIAVSGRFGNRSGTFAGAHWPAAEYSESRSRCCLRLCARRRAQPVTGGPRQSPSRARLADQASETARAREESFGIGPDLKPALLVLWVRARDRSTRWNDLGNRRPVPRRWGHTPRCPGRRGSHRPRDAPSSIRLSGVSAARRIRVKPASSNTSRSLPSPACACPIPVPPPATTSWACR